MKFKGRVGTIFQILCLSHLSQYSDAKYFQMQARGEIFYIFIHAYGDVLLMHSKYNSFLFVSMQGILSQIRLLLLCKSFLPPLSVYSLWQKENAPDNVSFNSMFSFENLNQIKQTVYFGVQKRMKFRSSSNNCLRFIANIYWKINHFNMIRNHIIFGRSINLPDLLFHTIMRCCS